LDILYYYRGHTVAVTVDSSGTITATVTTEHTLATVTGAGVYVVNVDTVNMAAGDVVELRVKKPVLSGGTARVMFYAMFAGVQPTEDVLKTSVPIVIDATAAACDVTLKQTLGTGRAFPWSILKLA
jgi:hypothetical protein